MNKTIRRFSFLFLAFCAVNVYAENGERVFDNAGNFSYCPPLDWRVTEYPGLKYKVVIAPAEGNFAANINFADETADINLKDYVNLNLNQLSAYLQGYKLINRGPFKTNSGISGEFIIVNSVQNNFLLRQVLYFLPAPNNRFIVIACTVLDESAEQYLPLFEDVIKTFELGK